MNSIFPPTMRHGSFTVSSYLFWWRHWSWSTCRCTKCTIRPERYRRRAWRNSAVGIWEVASPIAKFKKRLQGESFMNLWSLKTSFHTQTFYFRDDEGGIELQILNNVIGSGTTLPVDHSSPISAEHRSQSDELSCANSAVSVDFQEQLASTIGTYHLQLLCFSLLLSNHKILF